MSSTIATISSLIWSSADDVLRGLFKPSEYGRVILPFLVMRRLDCVLEPQKDAMYNRYDILKSQISDPSAIILGEFRLGFFNVSKYDLLRLKGDPNNILLNFNDYLRGFSKNVSEIISNFSITPLVEKLNKYNKLKLMIDFFAGIDLHPSTFDNHKMGSIYEELLRRFSEASNEESGDHFTPRDVVKLLVSLVFGPDKNKLQGKGKIRSVFDPCCGTGGMLTIGKDWVLQNINPNLRVDLYGQELNDVTFAICKADLLMMGEKPEQIHGPGSSISDDRLQGVKFDYMITNPPFGVSWKSEEAFVRQEASDKNGRFCVGIPRTSDGSLLFLQHLIHKMNPEGSRIGIIFSGSPLFNGDAGGGESEIRRWIFENDWLEAIISLPDRMFFNTGISTYIWILSNKKSIDRKDKVQLIDASSFSTPMKKNLGDKSKCISDNQIDDIFGFYTQFKENDFCKIYPKEHFGYTKITVERPLIENDTIVKDRHGKPKPDPSKRDFERVPLLENIDTFFFKEVEPFAPDSWMDRTSDKVGYEVNFAQYFFKFKQLRNLAEISSDLKRIDDDIAKLSLELANE